MLHVHYCLRSTHSSRRRSKSSTVDETCDNESQSTRCGVTVRKFPIKFPVL